MKAREYAPVKRLDNPPAGPAATVAQRREALLDALREVDLGQYDEETIGYLVGLFDDDWTIRTIISWIERARAAAVLREYRALETGSGAGLPRHGR